MADFMCQYGILTAAERAQSAFNAFIASLPVEIREDVSTEAWENTFSADHRHEYRDDEHRWEIALSTARMISEAK